MGHQVQSKGEEGVTVLGMFLFCMLYLRLTRLFYLLPIVVRSQGRDCSLG